MIECFGATRGGGHESVRILGRLALVAVAAVLLAILTGCRNEETLELRTWTLTTPEGLEAPVNLPAHFDALLARRPGTYTLHTRAPIPDGWRGRALTLALPVLEAETRLSAGGEEAAPLESSVVPGQPSLNAQSFRVGAAKTRSGEVDLALTVRRVSTRGGWIDVAPRLSATERGDAKFLVVRTVNGAVVLGSFAVLSTIGFTYLVLFFFDRSRRVHLLFAVQAMGVAYYQLERLGVLEPLVGCYYAAPIALALSSIAGVHFIHAYFGLGRPQLAWRLAPLALLPSLFGLGPFEAASFLNGIPIYLAAGVVPYQIVLLAKLYRQGRDRFGAAMLLAAWVLLGLSVPTDIVYASGFGELAGGAHLFVFGPTIFAVVQAVVLARDYIRSLRAADDLNLELRTRVTLLEQKDRENAALSDELRRQIADRSQRLADALARIGAVPERNVSLVPGEEVHGRYRIVRALGAGGMGAVYEVERRTDGRHFALKVLTSATTGVALARLAREAQIAAEVSHDNLVAIVDVDVSEGGALYLVMELVVGSSLLDLSERFGDRAWALPILHQIARGLVALHARGIVHRDLKPANVLVTPAGLAKIADFGIARLGASAKGADPIALTEQAQTENPALAPTETPGPALTRTGMLMGTPLYMAPDLASGVKAADPSADLFSFGVIAYELLLGKAPFVSPPILDALAGRAVPGPRLGADLPPAIAKLVERCLDWDPASRPTAAEVVSVLDDPAVDERSGALGIGA